MARNKPALPQHSNSPSPRLVDVAAGLVFRGGKLLITQRPAGTHLGGLWEFPGGKRRPQETFEQCLVRELREELGIEVDVGPLLETVIHAYPEKTVRLQFYHCRWIEHEPRALGCPAFKWITVAELANYGFPSADAKLLKRLQHSPEWWR